EVPLSSIREVGQAIGAAKEAFEGWPRTPVTERVQYLFKLRNLLEEHLESISRTITMECGKTLEESRREMRCAIENVEVACGTPVLMQGDNLEDVASGLDEFLIRKPLGVCAVIAPFSSPAMIPFWFLPYALACGNTYIVKPSEKVPLTMQKIFTLLSELGLPEGVVNLVNGAKETADAIVDHPDVRAISFVGSTRIARYVYSRATANGKRAQCQGGAKNPLIVLPDADIEMTTRIAADSAFGCAGQRCLAGSLAITVGENRQAFTEAICEAASSRQVGYGLDAGVQMGPVITAQSKSRIEELIQRSADEDAKVLVDGRGTWLPKYRGGNFVRPTVLDEVPVCTEVASSEIFGPVLGLMHVETVDEAIALVNGGTYGNMACVFTRSGAAARKFRYEAEVGNIGINLDVSAPTAFFPFGGWKSSFFGDLHAQGRHAVEFFTQTKVVVEHWPPEWSEKL
ncbi:MAG: CoA-acylating methylmalonate-semialdehyde dehydrogenase, partial [Acidobacteriota bacterium]